MSSYLTIIRFLLKDSLGSSFSLGVVCMLNNDEIKLYLFTGVTEYSLASLLFYAFSIWDYLTGKHIFMLISASILSSAQHFFYLYLSPSPAFYIFLLGAYVLGLVGSLLYILFVIHYNIWLLIWLPLYYVLQYLTTHLAFSISNYRFLLCFIILASSSSNFVLSHLKAGEFPLKKTLAISRRRRRRSRRLIHCFTISRSFLVLLIWWSFIIFYGRWMAWLIVLHLLLLSMLMIEPNIRIRSSPELCKIFCFLTELHLYQSSVVACL